MEWFRGQLHAHSYWSDGRGFPEQAIAAYRERGYQFLCLSEHNRFADDPEAWRRVEDEEGNWPPKVSRAIFEAYRQAFGDEWVDARTDSDGTSVRLKTHAELHERFDSPGEFLLIPGGEITQKLGTIHAHLNYANLPLLPPSVQGAKLVKEVDANGTVSELVAANACEIAQLADSTASPYMLMLDHPFTFYCDILPQVLIDCPKVRFFEICNNGAAHAPHPDAAAYEPEKLWDAVNAFRRINGAPLLYGVASDDAHFYDPQRIDGRNGVENAWIMVRARTLTPDGLITAMHRGDFYATNGVLLDDVTFTPRDRTLHVSVRPESGVNYRIHFITTRADFDRSIASVDIPADGKRPARTLPIYSDDVGRTARTVCDTEATYELADDELYVRARIESDVPSRLSLHFHPTVQTAWTQPYAPAPEQAR